MKNLGDVWPEGIGIFETIRVENREIFALHRHYCRAKVTAISLGFEIPTEKDVIQKSNEIINEKDFELARLRWYFAINGEFLISYTPYSDPIQPARLTVVGNRSVNYDLRRKEYPYRNLELLSDIKAAGYDDGIILTEDGQITETAIATLLLKIEGQWVTSPLSSGILNGVVRALVLEAGLAKVRRIEEFEIGKVESGFLLTSLRNAQPIGEISGKVLVIDREKWAEIHKLMASFKGR